MRVQGFKRKGLSLAEIVLSLGLLSVIILVLAGLSYSAATANQKSEHLAVALQLANQQLRRAAQAAAVDTAFWNSDHLSVPWTTGSVKMGSTTYEYEVFDQTLLDDSGQPLGESTSSRVKKMDIVVTWFGQGARVGQGERVARASCLVNEGG